MTAESLVTVADARAGASLASEAHRQTRLWLGLRVRPRPGPTRASLKWTAAVFKFGTVTVGVRRPGAAAFRVSLKFLRLSRKRDSLTRRLSESARHPGFNVKAAAGPDSEQALDSDRRPGNSTSLRRGNKFTT